jgi:hypothetical protein
VREIAAAINEAAIRIENQLESRRDMYNNKLDPSEQWKQIREDRETLPAA